MGFRFIDCHDIRLLCWGKIIPKMHLPEDGTTWYKYIFAKENAYNILIETSLVFCWQVRGSNNQVDIRSPNMLSRAAILCLCRLAIMSSFSYQ